MVIFISSQTNSQNNGQNIEKGILKKISHTIPGMGLFLKFFLGIWTIITLGCLIFVAWSYIYHIEPTNKDFEKLGFEFLKIHSKTMVELYESNNASMLQYMFSPRSTMFYDSKGTALIKDQVPFDWRSDHLLKLVNKTLSSDSPLTLEANDGIFIAKSIVSKSGKKYVVIRRFPLRIFNRHKKFYLNLVGMFPLFLIVTAGICFIFSRQVIKPVLDIQKAGESFANGNLKARVDNIHVERIDELGSLSSSFNDMAFKIEIMVLSQSRLQSDISHELRSPLARMQVAVDILRKQFENSGTKSLDRIELEVSRMSELIGNLLELSKVDKRLTNHEVTEFNLTKIICDIVEDANYETKTSNKKVIFNDTEKLKMVGSEAIIARAFENVIRNSVKYTKENSEIVINQSYCKENNTGKFEIIDDGSGIDEQNLALIFQPFFRCEESRERKTGGTGLGLAIAKRAISRHQGKIKAENVVDGGLKVTVELPLSALKA